MKSSERRLGYDSRSFLKLKQSKSYEQYSELKIKIMKMRLPILLKCLHVHIYIPFILMANLTNSTITKTTIPQFN